MSSTVLTLPRKRSASYELMLKEARRTSMTKLEEHPVPLALSLSPDTSSSIGDLVVFPREIRNKIYLNAIQVFHPQYLAGWMAGDYDDRSQSRHASKRARDDATLSILTVCKQITMEAAPILFQKSTFRFDFDTYHLCDFPALSMMARLYVPMEVFAPSSTVNVRAYRFMKRIIIDIDSRNRSSASAWQVPMYCDPLYDEHLRDKCLLPFTHPEVSSDTLLLRFLNATPTFGDDERFYFAFGHLKGFKKTEIQMFVPRQGDGSEMAAEAGKRFFNRLAFRFRFDIPNGVCEQGDIGDEEFLAPFVTFHPEGKTFGSKKAKAAEVGAQLAGKV